MLCRKPTQQKRQFRVRSLILVVAVIAVPLGWVASVQRNVNREAATLRKLEAYGARSTRSRLTGRVCSLWFAPLQGVPSNLSDEDLPLSQDFTDLDWLCLSRTRVTDDGMRHVRSFDRLVSLGLADTRITDSALRLLNELDRLQVLDLSGTLITDAGLQHLVRMSGVRWIDLGGTQITDAGLEHLKGSRTSIPGTPSPHLTPACGVSEVGVRGLRRALPECEIHYGAESQLGN